MPKIPPNVADTTFYLYKSKSDAEAGLNPQGTGFLLGVPDGQGGGAGRSWHFYGVTNWHVAVERDDEAEPTVIPAPVIRLNTSDGGIQVMDFSEDDWWFVEGGPDIAVIPLEFDIEKHKMTAIPLGDFFASRSDVDFGNIGVGEDVFMFGLFVDHGGVERNAPSARFGNISMLPTRDATVPQQTGYLGECFVLDMRSRGGFSGSPVFVYRTFGSDLTRTVGQQARVGFGRDRSRAQIARDFQRGQLDISMEATEGPLFKFLGVHFGQFPEHYDIQSTTKADSTRRHLVREGDFVVGMSGMTVVIPAWELAEVLNIEGLRKIRQRGGDEE
ncbi:hypothetical protein JQ607_22220 [Bradyrhizobium liaoningense]|uniref:hypothetical protein n=1 Tax=Bradyrhizobium liaoningense TaxID=43992 RepID=UPI001BA50118|nr:hypothetical protein [Bradyrhizobium liaoningense]MBR0842927.1 hypothetical protein [Bradyrhizobium liaoningense]